MWPRCWEDLATGGSTTKAEIEIIQSRMVLGDAVARTATDVVVTARRMPMVGNFLTNLGFVSGPFSSDYGFSWAADNINVTRFDVPDYALNLPHLIEFTGPDQFSLILDGATILDGRVGEQATGPQGGYRLFVQTKSGPSSGSFSITRLDPLSAIEALRERLTVSERGKDTGILSVTLDSPHRREASETLQQIVQIFLKQNVDRLSEEAEQQLAFLEKQIPDVRGELEVSENNLNAYRARNDSVDLTFETQSILEQLVRVENQLTELEFAEAEISQQFTKSHPRYEALLTKRSRLTDEESQAGGPGQRATNDPARGAPTDTGRDREPGDIRRAPQQPARDEPSQGRDHREHQDTGPGRNPAEAYQATESAHSNPRDPPRWRAGRRLGTGRPSSASRGREPRRPRGSRPPRIREHPAGGRGPTRPNQQPQHLPETEPGAAPETRPGLDL